ncbi:hypothetical protein BDV96DRAFT_596647 [Lophiotrema nucula]|uniref:SnoaL-like domain-containing protein n=1 Tax=Lophiotrema nucula TaxID=690887 RepID=A0A6A5ZH65_9PLEO|nr:hypothetical protein BDV96DRAFT_596647 [Lophiotrema nucula]
MSSTKQAQAATLQRYLDAWAKWDASLQLETFSKTFTQVTLPLGVGVPPRSRPEVEQVLPALVATVNNYELTVHHVVHDIEKNKAAVFATSRGTVPWGPWNVEYAVFITFSEAGDGIEKLEEYLDTAFLQDFGPKFGQHMHALGGPSGVVAAAKSRQQA